MKDENDNEVKNDSNIQINTMLRYVQIGESVFLEDDVYVVLSKTFIEKKFQGFEIEITLAQQSLKSTQFISYDDMLQLIKVNDILNMEDRIRKVIRKTYFKSADSYSVGISMGPV
jgi:hypothetical protein